MPDSTSRPKGINTRYTTEQNHKRYGARLEGHKEMTVKECEIEILKAENRTLKSQIETQQRTIDRLLEIIIKNDKNSIDKKII